MRIRALLKDASGIPWEDGFRRVFKARLIVLFAMFIIMFMIMGLAWLVGLSQ